MKYLFMLVCFLYAGNIMASLKCPDLPTELNEEPKSGWSIGIKDALFAHFKQESDESLPAYEWAVIVDNGKNRYPVMVRTFLQDDTKSESTQKKLADKAWYFVAGKLESGWEPKKGGNCFFVAP